MKSIHKKITAVFLATAIFVLCVSGGFALDVKRYLGDLDNDGEVSSADARSILLVALEITAPENLSEEELLCADVDGNGSVTVADAREALLVALGIKEPCEVVFEFKPQKEELLALINGYRSKLSENSLSPLTLSPELSELADNAAKEFTEETGSAYVNSDGSLYYKSLRDSEVAFTIAQKFVVEAESSCKTAYGKLIDKTGTKKALLSGNYSEIGIGAYSNDGRTFYWCIILTGNGEA